MRYLLLSLLAASAGFAQTQPGAGGATLTQYPVVTFRGECPVGMVVEQRGWGASRWITSLEDAREPGVNGGGLETRNAGVYVEMTAATGGKALSQVELAVYFVPPKSRVLTVKGSGDSTVATADRKKTFEMSASDGSARRLAGNLRVAPVVAGITRVDLMRITYADGSMWVASGVGCSVRPSLFMPVGDH